MQNNFDLGLPSLLALLSGFSRAPTSTSRSQLLQFPSHFQHGAGNASNRAASGPCRPWPWPWPCCFRVHPLLPAVACLRPVFRRHVFYHWRDDTIHCVGCRPSCVFLRLPPLCWRSSFRRLSAFEAHLAPINLRWEHLRPRYQWFRRLRSFFFLFVLRFAS